MPTTPRLNGQQAEFLVDRLKKFAKAPRKYPHLEIGMLKELAPENDVFRGSVAQYFSSQRPTDPKPGVRVKDGKSIYENGIAAENVIACNQCHGAQGEGHNAAPRLAGQHAQYLKAQLVLFSLDFRHHGKMSAETVTGSGLNVFGGSPAYHAPMNANTKTMTEKTMEALISYLANG